MRPRPMEPLERPAPPWEAQGGLERVLAEWRADPALRRALVLDEELAATQARTQPLPEALCAPVREALAKRSVRELYSHQAEAFLLASAGKDVVVATPTASGKSLCFNLPVLDALAKEREARALYLFPTKALARDQEVALRALMTEAGLSHGAITYDGDTPGEVRRLAREKSGVILTNPDMLHAGILPHHASWAALFSNLRFVVLDELHTYRGVFGSHLANVLRRLDRVARFHGSSPTFVFASATIGNPGEHASRLLGRPVALVDQSGAPSGARRVLVYQPPVVNAELGVRASYVKSAVRLTADLVRGGVSTLLFGQSRNTVEVMLKYLRDRLEKDKVPQAALMAYRGGYLPEKRRAIENSLRNGELRCVVSTNALELGIDIGALDAVVCAGYPGTVAGLWQRFGRAGRRSGKSLSLLVTSSAPLDQYVAAEPKALLSGASEEARIDPDNVEILIQHLKCAAFELPFQEGEGFRELSGQATGEALDFLAQHQVVHPVSGSSGKTTYHWATDAYPANHVSLRSVGWDNVVIIDVETDRSIAEMDWRSTHTMLHEQAIYQQEGEQYQVERLDLENHKAFVRKVAPDYYTDAMTHTRVEVLAEEKAHRAVGAFGFGEVSVVEKVVGYKKIKFHTHENVGYGDVTLPEMQMHTAAFWVVFPDEVLARLGVVRAVAVEALRGLSTAVHTVACAGLMIDPRDLGRTLGSRSEPLGQPHKAPGETLFDPTLFFYDHVPGGIGLAARLYEERDAVLSRARRLLEGCGCERGCPGCVGPEQAMPVAGSERRKQLAVAALELLGVTALH